MHIHVTGNKRGKTCVTKSRLDFVLNLIGREAGANFYNQLQSIVKQNQNYLYYVWRLIESYS